MNSETPRLRNALIAATLLLALATAVAGCGGSGSSGFDAVASEATAIQHVIDSGDCTSLDGQTYCASGVEAPGPFAGALVKIAAPQDRSLVCEDLPIAEKCTADLAFTTEGFDHPTSLLAAVAEREEGPWQLAAVTVANQPDGEGRTVSIAVPARTDTTEPTPLIAAVLVYDGTPPEDLPPTSAHLSDFGVDLVYVSQRLEIVVPR